MSKMKELFFTFATVTTCTVVGTAAYIFIFQRGVSLGAEILLQILFTSFATSLGIYLYPSREICKKEIIIRIFIHYVYVNVIILVCGLWFDWYEIGNVSMVIGMLLVIAAVFASVSLICWKKAEKDAARINEKLKEYQEEKEES